MFAPPATPAFRFHSDSFTFPTNQAYAEHFQTAGGRLVQLPTGHYVFYGNHGRRLLLTDPDGYPLHECEWQHDVRGRDVLARARVRLDNGLWVGLKPGGLTNTTVLNLSSKPGWERLLADDLRDMAARAMRVPMDEVRFFYGEEDLRINAQGIATIQHRKDALYLLEQGRFEHARFMACMGAMHWDAIDFLPVVELFQSLVPGTGSAIFELIRGLYDDQNAGQANPRPLRYRGIPAYPSEGAFRLFSAFFTPRLPGGADPFTLFMNAPRSCEVIWSPADDCPRRYVGDAGRLCVTVKRRMIEKLTFSDDHTGLPYMAPPTPGRPAPCDRTVLVSNREVLLFDRGQKSQLPVNSQWGPLDDTKTVAPIVPSEVSWTSLFKGSLPQVTGSQAFSAVLLYPEDAEEIDELSSQPFVMDYVQDLLEQNVPLFARLARARRVLVCRFDGVISGCIDHTGSRQYTIVYLSDRFGQKQAQTLWNRFAAAKRLSDLQLIAMYRVGDEPHDGRSYDLLYEWIPFAQHDKAADLERAVATIVSKMATGATAFVVGPITLPTYLAASGLRVEWIQPVHTMDSFRMHQSILPHARLKPGLTLFCLHRP